MKKYSLDNFTRDEIEHMINQRIHNARHRRVMLLRFLDGLTYEEIAEDKQVDRTPRQVGTIIRDCIYKLFP